MSIFETADIATPYSEEENISRGHMAMRHVISSHALEPHAMFRKEIGWIGFEWGYEGEKPPEFQSHDEFREWQKKGRRPFDKGGYGLAHIIAKRDWEGKYIRQFKGQKGIDVAFKLVEVIAKGEVHASANSAEIRRKGIEVILKRKKSGGKIYWLITGYRSPTSGYQLILESADELGSADHQSEGMSTNLRLSPSPLNRKPPMPTRQGPIVCPPMEGAADSMKFTINIIQPESNIHGDKMDGILEQAPGTAIDYVRAIQDASTFYDIADLFKKLFGVAVPPDPDKYKKEGSDYGLKVRGVKTREKINEQCKEILSRVTDPAQLTTEEREILLQYSGRGGLTDNSQWEYYTPTPLAEGIWEAMKANGFANGNVLEPSCGAGVFLGTKPAGVIMSANDLDPTSSGVAALLNPGDKVSNNPFEEIVVSTDDDTFDSCVGNVPFGNARGQSMSIDPAYKNEKRVERYFLLRILDKIKPGGLACLVVPTCVIGDKGAKWKEFRTAVSRKAEFLGAHKMPSSTFGGKGGQGTDTVTDVIVLRKHGRDLLDKLRDDEIPTDTLREANVYWDEFISGKYWQGEGRPFIMGKYVPKGAKDRFAREKVEGTVDDATLKRNLARKFHSRIKWDVLKAAEPILRNYAEGDSRYINGDPYEYRNGDWHKIEMAQDRTALDKAQYGAESVEELAGLLSDASGALSLTVEQSYQVYNAFPHLVGYAQKAALEFAMSQPREDLREQLYRGSILGSMLAKLAVDEEGGEDVSGRRAVLQDAIVQEMNKYGHPANNAKFKVAGASSRAFGMFMNSIDSNGKFSDLLAGTLDKSKAKGYAEDDVESIVSWLAKQNGDQIEFEDVQALYKGTGPMDSIADLAQFESVAITPDGMLEPFAKYCSGDVVTKMNELRTAMCATDDEKIIDKFQKQIDAMNAKIKRVPVENIVFGLQNKWFSKQYILDYLHENGYPQAVFGEMRRVEEEDYDGKIITRAQFIADIEAVNGEFRLNGIGGKKPEGYVGQLEKYLNGSNITSSGSDAQENISRYKRDAKMFESGFDSWMKQHPDSDDLAEEYSLRFNGFVPVEYDTGSLGIDDLISGEITPHTYQNAEVRRLSEQGSGVCGFGTGLGKSFTALAMAAYNYKKGRAKRTCVVVPSAVLENWYHEARTFYNEGYMRSNVLFVGLEPKVNKDGDIERRPILDEDGNPRMGKDGQPLMQDVVRFTKSKEDTFAALSKIPQSNYSLVVMTKEKFQSIPVRPETMKTYTEDMVKRSLLSEKQASKASANAAKKDGTSYADDVRKNQLEGQFSKGGGAKKGELPYLEDMGFDSIITDESHFFKNSMKAQKTSGIVGVPSPEPSQIAVDMSIKCDWLRRNNNGRGVYGLTATPVTNSPIEVFNMLSLVAPKEDFEQMGIYTVDDFVRMFGEMEERDRINVAQEVVQATTLVGFKNLDGLRNLFGKYVNIKTVKDVDDEIHVPNAVETQDEVPISEEQQKVYDLLRLEAKAAAKSPDAVMKWAMLSGGQKPRNMFSIMRDMDRCTTDMDLYLRQMTFVFSNSYKDVMQKLLPTLPKSFTVEEKDEETGEKNTVTYEYEPKIIDNGDTFSLIVHEQHESAVLDAMAKAQIDENEANHPLTSKYAKLIENMKKHIEQNGKQIIFTEEKSQHHKLKRILVHNLPFEDKNFGIINAEDADGNKLDKISKAYNSGTIRVVIANKKAEVGVNLQKGTTAIHHLTLPWTPASINQRNGRGVRQGNKVNTVEIYYYHGKGTFDAYRKQLLESKANWIGQLLSGKESTAENADIAAQEEMNALMSGNIEEYRKKKAEAEEKRKNASKSQLVNRLKMLASIQNSLSTLEERREAAREKAKYAIEEQKLRIKRYEQGNKGEETVKKAKADLAKLQAKMDAIDKKFDEEKTKCEAQRNMNSRMLREAAKKGELPFDESLIDHPEKCLITLKGEIYKIGEFLEFPPSEDRYHYTGDPEGVYQIEQLDQEDKELILRDVLGYGWTVRIKAEKVANKGKKVSYSASEMAIKKLMAGNVKYSELLECGVTKQQFLDNLETLSLDVRYGAVMQKHSGQYVLINSSGEIEDDLRYVWPEPDNEDFRKRVLSLWLREKRELGYESSGGLMRALFGSDYATLALEYGNKAGPAEINAIISNAWDNLLEQLKVRTVYQIKLKSGDISWIDDVLLEKALRIFADNAYDNKSDVEKAVEEFAKAKGAELLKLSEDAKKAAEDREKARMRESQNYKEIPADIDAKFKELGMTICYNTRECKIRINKYPTWIHPFSRIFVQDTAGVGGKLCKAKEDIKKSFNAEYTKSWNERFGSWWHMPGDIDLDSLYEVIAG